jgi:hypothetical protein
VASKYRFSECIDIDTSSEEALAQEIINQALRDVAHGVKRKDKNSPKMDKALDFLREKEYDNDMLSGFRNICSIAKYQERTIHKFVERILEGKIVWAYNPEKGCSEWRKVKERA